MAKYFERFMQWQNYAHYLLLCFVLIWMFPSLSSDFFRLYLSVFIGDSIIHGLFYVAPKPVQWRD